MPDNLLRLPNESDPLTPSECRDLAGQMMSEYHARGLRGRELLKCEMENMYRLLHTVGHLHDVIYGAKASIDCGNHSGALCVLNRAVQGDDLPPRTKIEGIDYLPLG